MVNEPSVFELLGFDYKNNLYCLLLMPQGIDTPTGNATQGKYGKKLECSTTESKYGNTVELQWLEHLWDHGNLFETWVVRATEG